MRTALAALALALLGAATLFALPGGAALANTNLEKCASDGAVEDAANNPGLVADCAVLLDSKEILQGKGDDARNLNWSSSLPMSQWDGVSIGEFHGGYGIYRTGLPNRVTELDLAVYSRDRTKKLKGKIPKRLGDLSGLRGLNLWGNELHGRIRPQLGNLSELIEMDLGANDLSGKLPKRLGDLSELMTLALDGNNLSGRIPKWMGRLSKLQNLSLSHNHLTGNIPAGLAELPKLDMLALQFNYLTGCMPPSLTKTRYIKMGSDEGGKVKYRTMGKTLDEYYRLPWCD